MVCAPVRLIIPSLKLGNYLSVQAHKPCSKLGDYLSVQAHKPCSISHEKQVLENLSCHGQLQSHLFSSKTRGDVQTRGQGCAIVPLSFMITER